MLPKPIIEYRYTKNDAWAEVANWLRVRNIKSTAYILELQNH